MTSAMSSVVPMKTESKLLQPPLRRMRNYDASHLPPLLLPLPPIAAARLNGCSNQYIRAIPIRILTVGKKRSQGIQLLVEEYKEKANFYCSMDDVLIRSNPKNTSNVKAQIEAEDVSLMRQIKSDDWVVVLDEHGVDTGSEQMANLIEDAGRTGSSRLCFCIGGPYGLGPKVRARADVTLRLSSLVLNHQIALIVLMEQIYRAWTILKGQKYHHL